MQRHLYIYILDEIGRNEIRQQCERKQSDLILFVRCFISFNYL